MGCGGAIELDVGEASPYFTSCLAIGSRETLSLNFPSGLRVVT